MMKDLSFFPLKASQNFAVNTETLCFTSDGGDVLLLNVCEYGTDLISLISLFFGSSSLTLLVQSEVIDL